MCHLCKCRSENLEIWHTFPCCVKTLSCGMGYTCLIKFWISSLNKCLTEIIDQVIYPTESINKTLSYISWKWCESLPDGKLQLSVIWPQGKPLSRSSILFWHIPYSWYYIWLHLVIALFPQSSYVMESFYVWAFVSRQVVIKCSFGDDIILYTLKKC